MSKLPSPPRITPLRPQGTQPFTKNMMKFWQSIPRPCETLRNPYNPTGSPGPSTRADINHVKTKRTIPEPIKPHKITQSNSPIKELKEHPKSYSEATRSGLKPEHPHIKVEAFESMWLSAKPPSIPTNNFPYRIEELSPSIWHTLYKKESNIFHAPTKSCLLCSRIDKIITKITECHKSTL